MIKTFFYTFKVLNRSLETRASSTSTPAAPAAPAEGLLPVALVPQHVITSGTAKNCVRLRGLPYEAQVRKTISCLSKCNSATVSSI